MGLLDNLEQLLSPEVVDALENEINLKDSLSDGGGRLVWRPGATGDNAPGGGVYVGEGYEGFLEFYRAYEDLQPFGPVELVWDNRFSSHISGNGIPACLIPVPLAGDTPDGKWDFRPSYWTNYRYKQEGFLGSDAYGQIEFADGDNYVFLPQHIDVERFNIVYDGTTGSPVYNVTGIGGTTFGGLWCKVFNTSKDAKPLFLSDGAHPDYPGRNPILFPGDGGVSGFWGGPNGGVEAPVVGCINGGQWFLRTHGGTNVADNALAADSNASSSIQWRLGDDAGQNSEPGGYTWCNAHFPNIELDSGLQIVRNTRLRLDVVNLSSTSRVSYSRAALCDVTGGDFDVILPFAKNNTDLNRVMNIAIGATGFDTVTIKPSGADRTSSAVTFVADDGTGNSKITGVDCGEFLKGVSVTFSGSAGNSGAFTTLERGSSTELVFDGLVFVDEAAGPAITFGLTTPNTINGATEYLLKGLGVVDLMADQDNDWRIVKDSNTVLVTYSDATRPAASSFAAGTVIWNTDDSAPNYSDGTSWYDAAGIAT